MAENTAIRILVVDDHPVLRDGVAAILETESDLTLVGEARDGAEAIVRFRELKPDVTLMDLQMPRLGGVEAITTIRAEFPNARILVLTTYDGDVQAVRALKAGAIGFLLKSSLRTEYSRPSATYIAAATTFIATSPAESPRTSPMTR